jgi:hypothetical protein
MEQTRYVVDEPLPPYAHVPSRTPHPVSDPRGHSFGLTPELRLEVMIDFSVPEATMVLLPQCVAHRVSIVIATTGFSPEQRREIEEADHDVAVLQSPNMSLVVNVLFQPVRQAGRRWPAMASTWRSSSGTTASRRTAPAARHCTAPRRCMKRWGRWTSATAAARAASGRRPGASPRRKR